MFIFGETWTCSLKFKDNRNYPVKWFLVQSSDTYSMDSYAWKTTYWYNVSSIMEHYPLQETYTTIYNLQFLNYGESLLSI